MQPRKARFNSFCDFRRCTSQLAIRGAGRVGRAAPNLLEFAKKNRLTTAGEHQPTRAGRLKVNGLAAQTE
jgi:hypothetical protein